MNHKVNFKDPMVIILACLLVFLTCGTALGGCSGKTGGHRVVIELDAAYGGDNTGYEGLVSEADVSESIVSALRDKMSEDKHFTVLLTHQPGSSASVKERAEKINKDKPDLVLSIRADGSMDASASGQTVYADIPSSDYHEDSLKAANAVVKAFTSDNWTPSVKYRYYQPFENDEFTILDVNSDDTKDYKLDTWDLMSACDVPVVISNQFYVTNQSDVDTWANESGYDKAAEAYYQALKDLYGIREE